MYRFHDFQRAYATVNAPRLKPEILQRLMRHKSYQTTQKSYINPTSQLEDAIANMPVRNVLRTQGAKQAPTGVGARGCYAKGNGASGIRTRNQAIMSRLL